MNMLEQLYVEVKGVKSELTTTNKRLDSMEADIKTLKQGQERIENKLDDMEAQNANRHIELSEKIDSLSKDISFVEAVTGKNTADIAFIKLAK